MQMTPAGLHTAAGQSIPIHLYRSEDKTLLECQNPEPFLTHVTRGQWTTPLAPDTYLRGVIVHDRGAFFQLFDQFGAVSDEVAHLDPIEAITLLREIW